MVNSDLVATAVLFAKEMRGIGEVAESLSKIEGISDVFMVTGNDDIVAIVNALSESELEWFRKRLSDDTRLSSFDVRKVLKEWKI